MNLPDRKCVELEPNQVMVIQHETHVFENAPDIEWEAPTGEFFRGAGGNGPWFSAWPVSRIVVIHDSAGHMVRIRRKNGWYEYMGKDYEIRPLAHYVGR